MLALLPLPLKNTVSLDAELLSGRAVAFRGAGGQLLGEGGGKTSICQGQHSTGTPAQGKPQFCFGEGNLQPQDISCLAKVGSPAAGVRRGITGQKDQSGLPSAAGCTHWLLADLQAAGLTGQTK